MRKRIDTMNAIRIEIRTRYRNRLRECRLRALIISEAELSRRTGIQRTTLSALENNRRFLPIEHALLIKEVLGCNLDDLYERAMPSENLNTDEGRGSVRP
jgi:DNA-binding XRE family transcriptional regulator